MSKKIDNQEVRTKLLLHYFNTKKDITMPIFLEDIELIFGFSRSKILSMEDKGEFPKHKVLHKNYWEFSEVKKAYHDFFNESK